MEYMVFEFGVYDIWFWRSCCIALHCITWHLELCRKPMVATVLVQHCLLSITMQLHTLLGMKAGVHVHLYAFLYGFEGWMWWSILRYTMNDYVSHCTTAYRTLDTLYGVVWIYLDETNMRSDSFSSKVSYGLAKGIVEILFIFPFLPFISLFLHIIYLIMGFYLHLCYFIFPVVMVTYMLWLVWVIFYCSIRILNYRSEVTHYKLMLCFHNMIT